jgi:hypothetical protein
MYRHPTREDRLSTQQIPAAGGSLVVKQSRFFEQQQLIPRTGRDIFLRNKCREIPGAVSSASIVRLMN